MNKIIKAINEGISKALDFNIDDLDSDFSIKKSKVDSKNGMSLDTLNEQVYYFESKLDFESILRMHEKYGISYKPSEPTYLYKFVKMFNNFNYNNYDLNWVDTSDIKSMLYLFNGLLIFNANISNWNVSNVTDMSNAFGSCKAFNQDLSKWDVSNVTNMTRMFDMCYNFNLPLNSWDVSNVKNMSEMFYGCGKFDLPLGNWNVSKVTNMSYMFYKCVAFNQDLNSWDVSNVDDFAGMFGVCSNFNKPLSNWEISKDANISTMLSNTNICELDKPVNKELIYEENGKTKLSKKLFHRMPISVISLIYKILTETYKGIDTNELIDSLKQYAENYGKDSLSNK